MFESGRVNKRKLEFREIRARFPYRVFVREDAAKEEGRKKKVRVTRKGKRKIRRVEKKGRDKGRVRVAE